MQKKRIISEIVVSIVFVILAALSPVALVRVHAYESGNGLVREEDDTWSLYIDGSFASDFTDLYYDQDYGWWLVRDGKVDFGYYDLFCSPQYGWWKVAGGTVDFGFNDLYWSPSVGWWKISGGTVDFGFNDLYCSPEYGWWKVAGGAVDFGFDDLYCSPEYGWWKVAGGTVDFGYNDLYCSPEYGWWKIAWGMVDFGYNDLYDSPSCGWWKIAGGTVDFGYNDLYDSPSCGWWKIAGGTVDFGYNDIYASPAYGLWKVAGGCVDFGYNGEYKASDGIIYVVNAGSASEKVNNTSGELVLVDSRGVRLSSAGENVMRIVNQYDPDGYYILKNGMDRGEADSISFYAGRGRTSDADTCVHEMFHDYTHSNGGFSHDPAMGFNWADCFYVGNGRNIPITQGDYILTENWSKDLPSELRTFRYDTYVSQGASTSSNQHGAYGLINEFCAYYWGLNDQVKLYPYFMQNGENSDFENAVQNGVQAFTEFRFYILGYLDYLKRTNPAMYDSFINNQNFVNVYCLMERKYENLIADAVNLYSASYSSGSGYHAIGGAWRSEAITLYDETKKQAYTDVEADLFAHTTEKVLPHVALR